MPLLFFNILLLISFSSHTHSLSLYLSVYSSIYVPGASVLSLFLETTLRNFPLTFNSPCNLSPPLSLPPPPLVVEVPYLLSTSWRDADTCPSRARALCDLCADAGTLSLPAALPDLSLSLVTPPAPLPPRSPPPPPPSVTPPPSSSRGVSSIDEGDSRCY